MKVFITGGCKNGKSAFAEDLAVRLAASGKRYYVATMIPFDREDEKRIAAHRASRAGKGFETIEAGRNIEKCLDGADRNAVFLVDSVTALLTNEMFPDMHSGAADEAAARRCISGLLKLAHHARDVVFVSDYIYSDAAKYDESTECFRRGLAETDKALASECDAVAELCAGNVIWHKGRME